MTRLGNSNPRQRIRMSTLPGLSHPRSAKPQAFAPTFGRTTPRGADPEAFWQFYTTVLTYSLCEVNLRFANVDLRFHSQIANPKSQMALSRRDFDDELLVDVLDARVDVVAGGQA